MPLTIRKATPDDAAVLVQVIDMASEGLLPAMWQEMAPAGADGVAVGTALVAAEDGEFSYSRGFVAELDGTKLGGLIGYRLQATAGPPDPDMPDGFAAIEELLNSLPGYWYINFMAVDPAGRGQGVGTALLRKAEDEARREDCPGLALIVVASNATARALYERAGYMERTRRPFDLSAFGVEPTEALLMVKERA